MERVRFIQTQRARQLREESEARKELLKRKDESQVEFFNSFKQRNEEIAKRSIQEREYAVAQKKGSLAALIAKCWDRDHERIEDVQLSRKEVVRLVHSMEETDAIYTQFMVVLAALERHPSFDNLEIQLQIALEGYQQENDDNNEIDEE